MAGAPHRARVGLGPSWWMKSPQSAGGGGLRLPARRDRHRRSGSLRDGHLISTTPSCRPSTPCSRRGAASFQVEDLHSTNGTLVNGQDDLDRRLRPGRSRRGGRHHLPGRGALMRLQAGLRQRRGLVRPDQRGLLPAAPGSLRRLRRHGRGARAGRSPRRWPAGGCSASTPLTAGRDDSARGDRARANRAIAERSGQDESLLGMGTTLTAALRARQGDCSGTWVIRAPTCCTRGLSPAHRGPFLGGRDGPPGRTDSGRGRHPPAPQCHHQGAGHRGRHSSPTWSR